MLRRSVCSICSSTEEMLDIARHFIFNRKPLNPSPLPYFLTPNHEFSLISHPSNVAFPIASSTKTPTSLPHKPVPITPKTPFVSPPLSLTQDLHSNFQEKMLYLDSIGINFFSLIENHPPVVSVSLTDIKSVVDFMTSMNFTAIEFRRIVGMCPEILTYRVFDIIPIFTFLLREARVNGLDLKRVINRRPRLLACSVKNRLRPTMYFLQSIGISEVNKHTSLLSCSVEDKLIPRIEYFEKLGLSHRDVKTMFRKFPQLFCYSIKENLEPKLNYLMVEMSRDLKEVKDFPQYFSFSLENRIRRRHLLSMENGVCFPLPVLLKTNEMEFQVSLEACCNSSSPLMTSPLWCSCCNYSEI